MDFEVLKKSHLKRNIIIGVVAVLIISAVILNFTRAKYKVTESIPLVNGTINYSLADLNAVAIYINGDSGYTQSDTIPETGYVLNEEKSYCTVNGEEDTNISLSYDADTKSLSLTPMTTKGTKCYLFFDEEVTASSQILAGKDIQTRNDFSTAFGDSTTGIIYQTTDWAGTSYYFAGAPTDNWVFFGGFYWRIVRINGDGTIRLIYQGTSKTTTGAGTQIGTNAFNSNTNRSYYVGLKYSEEHQHGQNTESDILKKLNEWYSSSKLDEEADHIDSNIGFCSDREMNIGSSWSSQPSSMIYYAAYGRLVSNKNPSLNCSANDIIKIPIGLITVDETALAGGVNGLSNQNYYLNTNSSYWTMTPYYADSDSWSFVFRIHLNGMIVRSDDGVLMDYGVRPVINLKTDTIFSSGDGTASNPFVVS